MVTWRQKLLFFSKKKSFEPLAKDTQPPHSIEIFKIISVGALICFWCLYVALSIFPKVNWVVDKHKIADFVIMALSSSCSHYYRSSLHTRQRPQSGFEGLLLLTIKLQDGLMVSLQRMPELRWAQLVRVRNYGKQKEMSLKQAKVLSSTFNSSLWLSTKCLQSQKIKTN